MLGQGQQSNINERIGIKLDFYSNKSRRTQRCDLTFAQLLNNSTLEFLNFKHSFLTEWRHGINEKDEAHIGHDGHDMHQRHVRHLRQVGHVRYVRQIRHVRHEGYEGYVEHEENERHESKVMTDIAESRDAISSKK